MESKTNKQAASNFEAFVNVDVALPRNQQALRSYLLNHHPGSGSAASIVMQAPSDGLLALPPLAIWLCVVGVLLALQSPAPTRAQWLAISATQRMRRMSPVRVAQLSDGYQYDLRKCLDEAVRSNTLQTISIGQFRDLGGPALDDAKLPASTTLLSYVDSHHEQIVIGLNNNYEPIYVADLDTPIPRSEQLKEDE